MNSVGRTHLGPYERAEGDVEEHCQHASGGRHDVQVFNAQTTEQREGRAVSVMPEPNLEIDCPT